MPQNAPRHPIFLKQSQFGPIQVTTAKEQVTKMGCANETVEQRTPTKMEAKTGI
jgi:hypothetical protein